MSYHVTRVTKHPVEMSITERRRLAQEIRNDLATYRRINSAAQSDERDRLLSRISTKWHRILGLEGCTEGPNADKEG